MDVVVRLPGPLRPFAGGAAHARVDVPGDGAPTVGRVLAALAGAHRGVVERVLDEQGRVRPHVNVFVGAESIRHLAGLDTPVPAGTDVWIFPAVSGGA